MTDQAESIIAEMTSELRKAEFGMCSAAEAARVCWSVITRRCAAALEAAQKATPAMPSGSELAKARERIAELERRDLPRMCRDGHPEIRHADAGDDEMCPVCRELAKAEAAGADLRDTEAALEESVKLQSHYAGLLNDYDGGRRLQFSSPEEWMIRLEMLREERS